MPNSCALVIFGASGDLARRKLIPAIYELARQRLLPEHFYVVGYSRSAMDDAEYRRQCRQAVENDARGKPIDAERWQWLEERLYYTAADYGSADDHARAGATLARLDDRFGVPGNRLFYLATPPSAFEPIIQRLGERHLVRKDDVGERSFQRIIIEKPFGSDLVSARHLNRLLHRWFDESLIFRIDHFLGKETVQNLMVMRFANSIFEPIWNYKYVDHVQITVAETLGVGSRGGYYDQAGALRDMVQNHLLQLMALVAMEPPVALDALSVRDEKVKVFKAVRKIDPASADAFIVRGQYGPGEMAGQRTEGYRRENGVRPDSTTETFVALKLFVDNWRWSGMPFYLRTGKFLPEAVSEVAVRFRAPPLTLFQKQCQAPVYPNDLIIRVQPDEGISLRVNGKVPGGAMNIQAVELDFLYRTTFRIEPPKAYERLLVDAMNGDQTLFIRADEVEAAWELIDPIETGCQQSPRPPEDYAPGTWGPARAMELIESDGRRWLRGSDEAEPIIACAL